MERFGRAAACNFGEPVREKHLSHLHHFLLFIERHALHGLHHLADHGRLELGFDLLQLLGGRGAGAEGRSDLRA